ncbi:NnrU domain [Dillenia turbinata]|uniref:NnrU domain n=1 Tax=Dillenia turbinata TaxID=194707 RepID=A0AAN8UF86_9MAGN
MATSALLSNPFTSFPLPPSKAQFRMYQSKPISIAFHSKILAKPINRICPETRRFPIALSGTSVGAEGKNSSADADGAAVVGEDSALFNLREQKLSSWIYFGGILGLVLFVLDVVWIDPSTGYGKPFIDAIETLSDSPEVVMLILIAIFATVHSGLASLRDMGEKLIGERAYRVILLEYLFLLLSVLLYTLLTTDMMECSYGNFQTNPLVHHLVWLSSFVSFIFLYPSTFNLLEVAAVDKPKMHLWETGIMRITRHPQMVGQVIWCIAHTVWIGNSVAAAASLGLIAHHLFGVEWR